MRGKFVTIFLFFVIALMFVEPKVNSQTFTTITNLATTTSLATFTQSSKNVVATMTGTTTFTEDIIQRTITLPGTSERFCYVASPINFDAAKGQKIQGKIVLTSAPQHLTSSMTLYILSDNQFKIWSANRFCDPADSGASVLLDVNRVTSYVMAWTPPEDGTYWLLVETWGMFENVVEISIAKQYSQAVTSSIYSTQMQTVVLTATKTLISVTTEQMTSVSPGIQGDMSDYIAIGAIAVLVLAIVLIVLRRRKGAAGIGAKVVQRPRAGAAEKQFCVNCGSALTPGSKFCNKCGSVQA